LPKGNLSHKKGKREPPLLKRPWGKYKVPF